METEKEQKGMVAPPFNLGAQRTEQNQRGLYWRLRTDDEVQQILEKPDKRTEPANQF